MKIFDYSPIPFDGGALSFENRVRGILKFGFSWVNEMKSQEMIIATLKKVLNNRFTILRNLPLPKTGITIPLLLLGPHGATVIYNSRQKGMFRATDDTWESLDNRLRRFVPSKPNLITRTSLMTRAVGIFLSEHGYALEPEGVLIFTHPGTHVETNHPEVRVLLMDAIRRFGARLAQTQPQMTVEDVRALKDIIDLALQPEEPEEAEISPPHQQKVTQALDEGFLHALAPIQKKLDFSRRQWLLLGGFVIADILILLGFLLFIILTA